MDAVEAAGQRPSGHGDEPRARGVPAVPAAAAPRPDRPHWLGPGPVRAELRPLQPDALHPAVPVRLRPDHRRPQAAPAVGLAHPRTPRARPHPRRRDDHRPARPGRRQRGRHGHGAALRARAVRPRRRARARACSTTPSGASPPTATSRKASPSEASSIAGHQQLGNLVLLYDDNHISIEGDTKVALSEDVAARYEAYGWHVQHVDDVNDVAGAQRRARRGPRRDSRPSFISVRSIIGWPAPTQAEHRHGARRGARAPRRSRATKEILGFDPAVTSTARTTCSRTPARSSTAAGSCTPSGRSGSTPGPASHPDKAARARPDQPPPAARGLGRQAAGLRRREVDGDPQGQRVR